MALSSAEVRQLQENVRVSKLAADVLGLISDSLLTPDVRLRFIKNLAAKLELNLTQEFCGKPDAVTPKQAAATKLNFGKYIDHTLEEVDEIDRNYLEWLCQQQEEFLLVLQQFLRQTAKHDDDE
jgi:hypothetical protein